MPCLSSLPGQFTDLKLAQRLAFAPANAVQVSSADSKRDALATLECIWRPTPPQMEIKWSGGRNSQQHCLTSCWWTRGAHGRSWWVRCIQKSPPIDGLFCLHICSRSIVAQESAESLYTVVVNKVPGALGLCLDGGG